MRILAVATLLFTASLAAAPYQVHSRIEPQAMLSPALRRNFAAFVSDFTRQMNRTVQDAPSGWAFWVALRPDPAHAGRPHVLIVARRNGLVVRVTEIEPAALVNSGEVAARAAARSRDVIASPTYRALSERGLRHADSN